MDYFLNCLWQISCMNPYVFQKLMLKWLENSKEDTMIMCHPGEHSFNENDPIRNARFNESQYLMSDDFKKWLGDV